MRVFIVAPDYLIAPSPHSPRVLKHQDLKTKIRLVRLIIFMTAITKRHYFLALPLYLGDNSPVISIYPPGSDSVRE